jgi:SNF2 family DNA or RNA helicase
MTITLLEHQQKGVDVAAKNTRYAMFWDPGLGKTMCMLAVCKQRPMPTLVICPKSIMRAAWVADAEKYGGITVGLYHGSPASRRKLTDKWTSGEMPDIVVTTFETFRINFDHLMSLGFRRIIVDESSKLKNPNSKITKAAIAAGDMVQEAYILSGTPAPNNPSEYWGQMRFLGRDLVATPSSGSTNFFAWASYWLVPIRRKIRVPGRRGRESFIKEVVSGYKRRSDRADDFAQSLNRASWFLSKDECVDLPEKRFQIIPVQLSPSEHKLYSRIAEGVIADSNDTESPVNAEVQASVMKLRQICGGTVHADEWVSVGKSKLEALKELMESLSGHPVVIWGEFRFEINRIHETLEEIGYKGHILYGGSINVQSKIESFQAGELDYLVCHPAAVGHGITLTKSSHAIYYALGYSYEQHQQSIDRIHRVGQNDPCTYYYLIAEDTVDEIVYQVLRNKADRSSALIAIVKGLRAET